MLDGAAWITDAIVFHLLKAQRDAALLGVLENTVSAAACPTNPTPGQEVAAAMREKIRSTAGKLLLPRVHPFDPGIMMRARLRRWFGLLHGFQQHKQLRTIAALCPPRVYSACLP